MSELKPILSDYVIYSWTMGDDLSGVEIGWWPQQGREENEDIKIVRRLSVLEVLLALRCDEKLAAEAKDHEQRTKDLP